MLNVVNLNIKEMTRKFMYRSNRSQTKIAIANEATITMTTVISWACTLTLSLQKTTTNNDILQDATYINIILSHKALKFNIALLESRNLIVREEKPVICTLYLASSICFPDTSTISQD